LHDPNSNRFRLIHPCNGETVACQKLVLGPQFFLKGGKISPDGVHLSALDILYSLACVKF